MRLSLFTIAISLLTAADITFNKDVLPVLQKRCQGCHRAGEAAPMALLTYKDARPFAAAIREAVQSGKMPPWHADPHAGKFSNDRRLSQPEKDILVAWSRTGAKEGNPQDAPQPIVFSDGFAMGKPDLILDMGATHTVPAKGTIDYTYYVVPSGFTEDKWVEKIEARPGARSVVHHIVVQSRPPGSPYLKDAKPGVPFTPYKSDRPRTRKSDEGAGVAEGLADGGIEMIATYVPGGDPYLTRPGQARLIPAGSDIIFQMHYTANGAEAQDRSQIGIIFAKEPPRERVVNSFISNRNFVIPPGDGNRRVEARVTLLEDTQVQSFFPHMHLRGKAMEYRAKFPDGETKVLLSVPQYDFNWQMTYQTVEPVLLPKGTQLEVTAWFDNSANNKYNPDATATVYWGDQSWEEMVAGFVDFVIPVGSSPSSLVKKNVVPAAPVASGTAGGN